MRVERGSKLDPIDIAVGAALGGDDVGGEVGPIKEPPGTKDGGKIEDQKVIGGRKGRRQEDVRGWSTSWASHHCARNPMNKVYVQ